MLTKFARSVTARRAAVVLLLAGVAIPAILLSGGGDRASRTSTQTPRLSSPAGVHSASSAASASQASATGGGPMVATAVHHDVSPPLREIQPAPSLGTGPKLTPDAGEKGLPEVSGGTDTVVQSKLGAAQAPATSVNFDALAAGQAGPTYAPPDTNGAVGPSRYFEIANAEIAIYTKTGSKVYGPVQTNTLWNGFGGGCQAQDDGDGTVVYDRMADRWVVQQFVVSSLPYLECVAISTTGDPTGSYYRYSFSYGNTDFPDYPKLGVWSDGYYVTYNIFANGFSFSGPEVCAFDRTKMLSGLAATQQCFKLSTAYSSLLPSDVDGSTAPPAGSPNFLTSFGSGVLRLWKYHVDWGTPGNSTLTGPTNIAVAGFSQACGGGTCIPQLGTGQQLDSLGDRLMYRLAYRNFGDHESLVVDHSVTAGSSVGMRWYELRSPNGSPTLYQQGTFAPDSNYRWMGSIAMDHNGDMAMGYSVSSASMHPSIWYTGRLAGDTLGQMTQGEGTLFNGTGSQNGGLSRWGDYSSMNIDPSDDCTFWYTTEYIPTDGQFNWHTRIGAFKFASCGGGGSPPTVTSFSPTSGPVGTQVDVQGTNFTGATSVTFNGTADASFVVNSSTDITAHVPAGATTGPIAVSTPNGTGTSASNFTVTGGGGNSPVVSSFSPTSGPVGTIVTVNGSNFTGSTSVKFNGTSATFTVNSDAKITTKVPSGATTGKISVTNGSGTGTSASSFTVTTSGPPSIASFTPTRAYPGTKVTITGHNFTGATVVRLGTAATSFTVVSSTTITATVPNLGFGYRKWQVVTPSGTATSISYFLVL